MAKNIIVVEGETEEKFYKETRHKSNYQACVKKCNVLEDKIQLSITSKVYDIAVFVIDLDILKSEQNISKKKQRFKNNVKLVQAKTKYFLLQCDDFEDELIYAGEGIRNINDLCEQFSCKNNGKNSFKAAFLHASNIGDFLKKIDFQKLYVRGKEEKNMACVSDVISKRDIRDGKWFYKK